MDSSNRSPEKFRKKAKTYLSVCLLKLVEHGSGSHLLCPLFGVSRASADFSKDAGHLFWLDAGVDGNWVGVPHAEFLQGSYEVSCLLNKQ